VRADQRRIEPSGPGVGLVASLAGPSTAKRRGHRHGTGRFTKVRRRSGTRRRGAMNQRKSQKSPKISTITRKWNPKRPLASQKAERGVGPLIKELGNQLKLNHKSPISGPYIQCQVLIPLILNYKYLKGIVCKNHMVEISLSIENLYFKRPSLT